MRRVGAISGFVALTPGATLLRLSGMGSRIDGGYRITLVRYRYTAEEGFRTEFEAER